MVVRYIDFEDMECWCIFRYVYNRLVLDFGGRSLDTNPDFFQYWHFCGTIIDVRTDRNPY